MKTRFHCRACGTVVTETSRKAAMTWPCLCGRQDYIVGMRVVYVPVLPIDPDHDTLVDRLVNEAIERGRK